MRISDWSSDVCSSDLLPSDIQSGYRALTREDTRVAEYLMPPLPNTLYTRDTTCWIYGGVTLNPLYWPARQDETLLMQAIYEFHPARKSGVQGKSGSVSVDPGGCRIHKKKTTKK